MEREWKEEKNYASMLTATILKQENYAKTIVAGMNGPSGLAIVVTVFRPEVEHAMKRQIIYRVLVKVLKSAHAKSYQVVLYGMIGVILVIALTHLLFAIIIFAYILQPLSSIISKQENMMM